MFEMHWVFRAQIESVKIAPNEFKKLINAISINFSENWWKLV